MNIQSLPKNATEYMTTFRFLAAITNEAMDYIENNPPVYLSSLDRVAQNVGTISSMRGDSGIYQGSRPIGLIEYQKEMYSIEDQLFNRLIGLGYKLPDPPHLLSATI